MHGNVDLMGDFVTLFSIIIAQRPPSPQYPYGAVECLQVNKTRSLIFSCISTGYGKFESLGTIFVSVLLLLGGTGVFLHSYALLAETVAPWLATLDPSSLQYTIISNLLLFSPSSDHSHHHGDSSSTVSSTALWFPILGIIVKEYLYRMTKKVAEEENSSVLMANALHHRSDAFGSVVTVIAIFGSIVLKDLNMPLDPLGGMYDPTFLFPTRKRA